MNYLWTTKREINFIEKIGNCCGRQKSDKEIIELLQAYIEAWELRRNWDSVNKFEAKAMAITRLERLKTLVSSNGRTRGTVI